ncbi:MAG: hypothetical protein GPOALKHO_000051 [Sodalis sp.]|nr:MAG: hypothetical protein GPOALKHO_000051 [Sodalis sp.]
MQPMPLGSRRCCLLAKLFAEISVFLLNPLPFLIYMSQGVIGANAACPLRSPSACVLPSVINHAQGSRRQFARRR